MELRTYKIWPLLVEMGFRDHGYRDEQIVDMLNRAEAIGFNLKEPASPLEELTLSELEILTRDTGEPS